MRRVTALEPSGPDRRSLAASLAPALSEVCEERLSDITWFRTDWQRGGAATGYASYTRPDGTEIPAVVKIPVVQRELTWTRRLQSGDDDCVVPRLLAWGDELGGYDLTWMILERLEHGPLGLKWNDTHLDRLADAAVRFALAARAFPVDREPRVEDWTDLLRAATENVRINELEGAKRWRSGLKQVQQRLDPIVARWRSRSVNEWLHGDLHFANAMSRVSMTEGPVTLIDLAEVRPGHWVEDAVFLERRMWARPERLGDRKPVRMIAEARRRRGLPIDPEDHVLASIRRLLLASTAPAFLKTEGNPKHLAACLDWMERSLAELRI